jgi:hypothetical protein
MPLLTASGEVVEVVLNTEGVFSNPPAFIPTVDW